jgi:hypothetical protein
VETPPQTKGSPSTNTPLSPHIFILPFSPRRPLILISFSCLFFAALSHLFLLHLQGGGAGPARLREAADAGPPVRASNAAAGGSRSGGGRPLVWDPGTAVGSRRRRATNVGCCRRGPRCDLLVNMCEFFSCVNEW